MASVLQRKTSSKKFKFINKGKLDFNFPLSYNFLLGYSDRDFKLEERTRTENANQINYG